MLEVDRVSQTPEVRELAPVLLPVGHRVPVGEVKRHLAILSKLFNFFLAAGMVAGPRGEVEYVELVGVRMLPACTTHSHVGSDSRHAIVASVSASPLQLEIEHLTPFRAAFDRRHDRCSGSRVDTGLGKAGALVPTPARDAYARRDIVRVLESEACV